VSERGIVLDIQRASLRDGPGIRTTIFLKGCPLRCLWCHNPEAISPARQLFFFSERCVLCGACEAACAVNAHDVRKGSHEIDFEKCDLCAKCIGECNSSGLKIVGTELSVDDLLREVMADVDFYENSGGGVTLSGGEPLFQYAFALEILKRCKQTKVHTCVETSGFLPSKKFEEILPHVDLWLFDYKATLDEDHQAYTGVSNKPILANLDTACQRGQAVILRCPIVPGVNDTPAHFRGIRALDQKYPQLKGIELMPYHDYGNSKRTSIGRVDATPHLRVPTEAEPTKWLQELKELGCEKVRIG